MPEKVEGFLKLNPTPFRYARKRHSWAQYIEVRKNARCLAVEISSFFVKLCADVAAHSIPVMHTTQIVCRQSIPINFQEVFRVKTASDIYSRILDTSKNHRFTHIVHVKIEAQQRERIEFVKTKTKTKQKKNGLKTPQNGAFSPVSTLKNRKKKKKTSHKGERKQKSLKKRPNRLQNPPEISHSPVCIGH
jgi:hypothetical protein